MRTLPIALVSVSLLAWGCASPGPAGHDVPGAAEGNWLARAQQHLAEREYRPSENERGLQAPNRAHDLRTYFAKSGIRVQARTASDTRELLRLSLSGVGRAGNLSAAAPGEEIAVSENRVEIRRPGIVEWYVNSPAGLEQGFTIPRRPAGDGPLVVELSYAGAQASPLGDAIVFETAAKRTLHYGQLFAIDARREPLAARFELRGADRIRIVVADAGAIYPLTIDPLITGTADTQLESELPSAQLGFSAASAGDVNGDGFDDVIVGAPNYDVSQTDEGAAFVFLGSASGIANGDPGDAATELRSDQESAHLGGSVAGAGDVNGDDYDDVIVGARDYDAGQSNEGAAFVFLGSASGIADARTAAAHAQLESNQPGLTPSSSTAFGNSVASAGDVNGDGYADVIVGAPFFRAGQTDEGAAFVFLGSSSGVADGNPATAAAQLESNQASAQMGTSVAGAGDVNGDDYDDVIAGAPFYSAGQAGEGAAFVFLGSASGVAAGNPTTAAAQLESNAAGARLGTSVAGAGNVNGDGYADVIVGTNYSSSAGAFIFEGSASGVVGTDPTTAATRITSATRNVAGAGDVNGDGYDDVVVGNDAASGILGHVYVGSASGVADADTTHAAVFLNSDDLSPGPASAASAGDVNGDGYADVIVGATGYGDGGAALVYLGGAGIGIEGPQNAAASLVSDQTGGNFGITLTGAGDVNGDGYDDVIVGAPHYDAGESDEGAAFVFLGGRAVGSGSPASAAAQLESNRANALFGSSVDGAGDVNGDDYGDVIVGVPSFSAGPPRNAAFVFLGSAAGIADGNPDTAATQLDADAGGLGLSVAGAGDVNGDGFDDVIAGVPFYDAGQTDEGAAFVFLGSASGIADGNLATAATRIESNQGAAHLGESVAGAGDVNGDGYDDVLVGTTDYSALGGVGAAFVYHGTASGIPDGNPATAAAELYKGQGLPGQFGASLAGTGDVNGDGYDDVIVGAPGCANCPGAAYVFLGSISGVGDNTPFSADTQLVSAGFVTALGSSVAGAGDLDGDGYDDVIVGAPSFSASQPGEGAAFVFPGSAVGVADADPSTAAVSFESNQAVANMGASVAGIGDMNGDGYADLLVGAPEYDTDQTDAGAAFVFLGNPDIHLVPEPDLLLSLAAGVVLLGGLARRRSD